MDPSTYYDEAGEDEWERLKEHFVHRLEYENTVPYLEDMLPSSGHVLDAGGAAGRYTAWLADQGYTVTLTDLSRKQLEIADRKLTDRGLRDSVTIHQDDIRDMDLESNSFDAVLCLGGPLSHVTDPDERRNAAAEFNRVVQSGAPVLVSVMGFYGLLVLAAVEQWGFIYEYEDFLERQTYDDRFRELTGEESSFADTYFFKPQQLRELLEGQGMTVETIVGLEPVASALDKKEDLDNAFKQQLRGLAGDLREEDASPYLSNHILAVARAD